jgi:hypothetical protein
MYWYDLRVRGIKADQQLCMAWRPLLAMLLLTITQLLQLLLLFAVAAH